MQLLRDYGTLRRREVLEPAIGYAADGFPRSAELEQDIARCEPLFREHWPTSAETSLQPRRDGRLRLPGLAATYRRIVAEAEAAGDEREAQIEAARDAFYRGWVADAIDRFVSDGDGLLTADDLAGWSASYEPPVTFDYRDVRVCKPGPWSQGRVFLQQLALLEGFALDAMRPDESVHTVIECSKLAFADREAWYGDPAFCEVPLDELLSRAYNNDRRRLVGAEASLELRPGAPGGRAPLVLEPGRPERAESVAPAGRCSGSTSGTRTESLPASVRGRP
jgi:gamma-glutamyltranspeptidase/glutathione hydrolase